MLLLKLQPITDVSYSRKFDNFSNQKNHALQFATSDWVLFLDGDERITQPSKRNFKAMKSNTSIQAINSISLTFYMNRFLYHHDNNVTRLVVRDKCHFEGNVHEKLIVEGSIGTLKNKVLHYTYKGFGHYIGKKDAMLGFKPNEFYQRERDELFSFSF